jgi:hypothetical protein
MEPEIRTLVLGREGRKRKFPLLGREMIDDTRLKEGDLCAMCFEQRVFPTHGIKNKNA